MIKNLKDGPEEFKDYDSELLFKILNKTLLENEKGDDKELFVDENWKINSKNMSNIIHSDNSNLKIILSDIFPNKKIVIQDNNDGSQTIFYHNLGNIKTLFILSIQYLFFEKNLVKKSLSQNFFKDVIVHLRSSKFISLDA